MKRILYFAAALLAVAACSREQGVPDEPIPGSETELTGGLVSVTLVAGSPETRTELGTVDDKPYPFWSAGDNIWVLPARAENVPQDQYGNHIYPATLFESGLTGASPSASFTGDIEADRTYLAFYPDREEWDEENDIYTRGVSIGYDNDENYPYLCFSIPEEQYPTRNSFDKRADFLVSEPFTVDSDDITDGKATVDDVCFTRVNAIVKVVLHDMTTGKRLSGQIVKRVVLGDYEEMEGEGRGRGRIDHAPALLAKTRAEYFGREEEQYYGLAGSVLAEIGANGECEYSFWGDYGIAAIYTDGTDGTENTQYAFDEDGLHTTYFVTVPCVVKNFVREFDGNVFGLRIKVETDDMVIERDVILPDEGIGLQPSRITTLNIGLYDDGVKETTILENGFSFMHWDEEEGEDVRVSSLSVKEDTYEGMWINLVGLTLDEEEWESELLVTYDPENSVFVDFTYADYYPYAGEIYGVRVWGYQATAANSPATVTFSAGGYSSSLQVNVIKANSPASISLSDIGESIIMDQYDVLSLNAVITPDDPTLPLEANYNLFACKLYNPRTNEENLIEGAEFEESELDPLGMVISLPALSEAGEFELKITYKDVTFLTIPFIVWAEAELPERLKTWPGSSFSGASNYAKTWFKGFRNSKGNLKTYKASLAQYGEGEGNVPDYAFAGAFENTGGSFDAFQYFTGLTKVPDYAFTYCKKMTGITLPRTISTIGEAAFSSCNDLTRVTLLENTIITTINSYAFSGCTNLASLSLPEGLLTIGDGAFNGAGLTSISIPGSVTSIGSSVFYSCSKLSEVTFDDGFSLTEIPDGMFYFTDALRSITIPASVVSIGENAFFANPPYDGNTFGLQSVTFLGNVTTIGYMAFCFCPLTEINLPASVTTIGDYAFSNTSLSSIVIPAQVSFIGEYAFNNVTFRSGTDGEGVTYQGVKFMGSTPPTFKNSDSKIEGKHWDTLANNNQGGWANGVNIYVPTGKKDDYVSVSNINPDINTELRNSLFVEY